MTNGRSRNPFAHILRFAYFTMSALSLVWMLAQYGGVNVFSAMILLPVFAYLALHLISLVNLFKNDKFLVGSSCDVLSLGAQKWIHRAGLILPIPILLYVSGFASLVLTYNVNDEASYNRTVEFSAFESSTFGKSVIWSYLLKQETPEVAAAPPVESPQQAKNVRDDIDFQPFMNDLQRRIKRAWFPPKSNDSHHTEVTFKVSKDGIISDAKIIRHGSTAGADEAALSALRNASPARPLPAGASDKVEVEFTFDYNVFGKDGDTDTSDGNTASAIQSDPIAN